MAKYSREQVRKWLDAMSNGMLNLSYDNIGFAEAALDLLDLTTAPPSLPPGYLTPHFQLSEFTRSSTATARGIDNTPNSGEADNLLRLAGTMEKIRTLLHDNPITITSAFRSEALNQAVGGVPNSAHRLGLAADFVSPGFGTPKQIAALISANKYDLDIDQVIYENKGGSEWVHVGLSEGVPRYQALTITDSGTQTGIV